MKTQRGLPEMPLRSSGILRNQIRAACSCHQGKRRSNNEDNYYFNGMILPVEHKGQEKTLSYQSSFWESLIAGNTMDSLFFAVFDGIGGEDYGDIASFTAAEATKKILSDSCFIQTNDVTVSLQRLCTQLNQAVVEAAKNLGTNRMGSTMVSLYFQDDIVWCCNIGDSKCFLIRDGQLTQISKDHNDAELLKDSALKNRKPALTQYLGIDPQQLTIEPYIERINLEQHDILIICSDGITDMVSEQQILNIVKSTASEKRCTDMLIQMALDAGGNDNATVILCSYTG